MQTNQARAAAEPIEKMPIARVSLDGPRQLNLFGPETDPSPVFLSLEQAEAVTEPHHELNVVKSGDLYQVVVSGFGVFLGKKSERLVVRRQRKSEVELPFFRLGEVIVASPGISLSSDLVAELCRRGARISFLHGNGTPFAMLSSPSLSALVEQRRQQMLAYQDRRGAVFAREVVRGKVSNQAKLLNYFNKYHRQRHPEEGGQLEELARRLLELARKARRVAGDSVDSVRSELMGLEGAAGRLYWSGVQTLLASVDDFEGRRKRGASDAVNSALNYGYGILYSQAWGALLNAGLEPFAGFLHADRPGKPSLALDLVEEFRQPIVDRVVLALFRGGTAIRLVDGLMDGDSRREVASRVLNELENTVQFRGKRRTMRSVIQMQARLLAGFLRGEKTYKVYSFKW